MVNETSSNDIFRFIQLRPMRSAEGTPTIALAIDTPLAKEIQGAASPTRRAALANAALKGGAATVRSVKELPLGPQLEVAIKELEKLAEPRFVDLLERLPELKDLSRERTFTERYKALSNTLFAHHHATQGFHPDLRAYQHIYRIYDLLKKRKAGGGEDDLPLKPYLRTIILAPAAPRTKSATQPEARSTPTERPVPNTTGHEPVRAAVAELLRLDTPANLVKPEAEGGSSTRGAKPFTLTGAAREQLSAGSRVILKERGIDLGQKTIDAAVLALHNELLNAFDGRLQWPNPVVTTEPGVTLPPAPVHALVRPAGVADLLVVKQQIKRFEPAEIAHVENVLIGEKKSRAHRHLERSEETFSTDSEVTTERQTELETADRFELNRETARTVQNDQQTSLSLSLSGKYGPTVEFSSDFSMEQSTSTEESAKSSSSYARDVVNRSLERITQRIREQRSRTNIRETEETNLHELHNTSGNHVRGVYQFIDKVYEAQVFNYGIREMFDIMVPEPASFLWHLMDNPHLDLDLPPAPDKLELVAPDATAINETNALPVAGRFGAVDVEPPPPPYLWVQASFENGQTAIDGDEDGRPRSGHSTDIAVPPGYRPMRATVRIAALTDTNYVPSMIVMVGQQKLIWKPTQGQLLAIGGEGKFGHDPRLEFDLSSEQHLLAGDKMKLSVLAYETNTYNVHCTILVQRTSSAMDRWRLDTYKKIRAAYEDRLREYQTKVEELTAAAEAAAERAQRRPFGAPPAENERTIRTELKKHSISMLTQQRYDAFDATQDGSPPSFDFDEAAAEGAYIRFFEQAFEWDQLQYVFYPYFWGRKRNWIDRFVKQDDDPRFAEFLKAGSARVVLPVRPGFELALTHYLETGNIWGGEGEPPQISSPLYVSIVDEIRERTGAGKGEVAIGEPWDVRVPTALAIIRDRADLPAWERTEPEKWNWKPVGTP